MFGMWGVHISVLLSCASTYFTVSDSVSTIDLDHKGHVVLMRSEAEKPSELRRHHRHLHHHGARHHSSKVHEYAEGANDHIGDYLVNRYRRGAWGTLECGPHTVPVSNELDCMDAAEATGGKYQPVGSWHESPEGCVVKRPEMIVIYVRHNDTSQTVTDFPNYAKLCDAGNPTPCPEGYNKEVGDVTPEWGDEVLGSYQGGIYANTMEECRDKCNADARCMSFKWSPTYTWGQESKLVCVLNSIRHPTVYRTWLDFVFCAKSDAMLTTGHSHPASKAAHAVAATAASNVPGSKAPSHHDSDNPNKTSSGDADAMSHD